MTQNHLKFGDIFQFTPSGIRQRTGIARAYPCLREKRAVYVIRHKRKTIYIGQTSRGGILNRLRSHAWKLLTGKDPGGYCPQNWKEYHKKLGSWRNRAGVLGEWRFEIFAGKQLGRLDPSEFEPALITAFTAIHGNAPECNDEYCPNARHPAVKLAVSRL